MRAAAALIVLALAAPAAATECAHRAGDRHRYWSWREIDGRACWYLGARGKPKGELHWPAHLATRTATRVPAPPPLPALPARLELAPAQPAPPTGPTLDPAAFAERWGGVR